MNILWNLQSPVHLAISSFYQDENSNLFPGNYILTEDTVSPMTGEVIALKNTRVIVENLQAPIGKFQNINIYRVKHSKTNQDLYVSNGDITRWEGHLKNTKKCGKTQPQIQ